MQFESLNEISKVAAVKATSALSKLLEFPLGVDVVPVETKRLDEISNMMISDVKVVGLNVPVLGPLPGTSLLIYPEDAAFAICDAMFHRKAGETKRFSESEISALMEVANIVIGNFLSSFAMPLQIDSILHRAADFTCNQFSALIKDVTDTFSKTIKEGIVVKILFHFKHIQIIGTALFLFDEQKMQAVVKELTS